MRFCLIFTVVFSDSPDAPTAPPCDPNKCRLPDCRCSSTEIPGNLLPDETPQLVMLTFEGAIRVEDYNHLYQQV